MNDSTNLFETLLASTVHDMKNSLSLVMSEVNELSARLDGEDDRNQSASSLRYEIARINNALMKLLSLYKLQKKRLSVQITEVLMVDVIEDSIAGYASLASNRGVKLHHQCDDELIWFFDSNLFAIVLDNIISNSIRYSKTEVLISATIDNGMLRLDIEDDGRGYPEQMLMDPDDYVNRVDYATGSTGLGLYFAAVIANAHSRQQRTGKIELTNNHRMSGGCFSVFLP